jgi:hypothetical protein
MHCPRATPEVAVPTFVVRSSLAALLAVAACGPIEEEEGALGNGDFYYLCGGLQDQACPPPQTAESEADETLPFPPEIALGGTFGVSYGNGNWLLGTHGTVEQVSGDWIASAGSSGNFTAERVGNPWLIALDGDGGLLDLLEVNVVPVASITVGPARQPIYILFTPPAMADVAGTTHAYAATALDAHGSPLAGDVAFSWASSDPSVIVIVGGGAGTTSVAVLVNGATVQTILATVGPPPASSLPPSIDAGALVALQNAQPPAPSSQNDAAVEASASDAGTDANALEAAADAAAALDGTGAEDADVDAPGDDDAQPGD